MSSYSSNSDTRLASQVGDTDAQHSAGGGITYAIGDIHGRLDLLERAADAIMADLGGRPGRIICLGDYVDRGPDSKGVIEFLMRAQSSGVLTCLKGNHEDLMLEGLSGRNLDLWIGNGGGATLASYGADGVPQDHRDWLAKLPHCCEAAGRVFVHAGFMPGPFTLSDQEPNVMMWIRDRFLLAEKDFADWPHIVHGHTPVHPWKEDPEEPELLGWRTNLDTAAFHTGILTVGVFEGEGGPPSRTLHIQMDQCSSRRCEATCAGKEELDTIYSPHPITAKGLS